MGKGGGDSTVTGYRYYLAMLFGLSRGPLDSVIRINAGDVEAWRGNVTDNERITINQPELFGGDKKEGGLDGFLDFQFGAADQDLSAAECTTTIGGRVSSLRGVTTAFWTGGSDGFFSTGVTGAGEVCANNPYPKPWTFRVRRALKGWFQNTPWYPEEAIVALDDGSGNEILAMNPAHIIYECLTNPVWGRGLPAASLDDESFTSAANTLCRESFGLCLKWTRSQDLATFIQLVIDHIGGVMYVDRNNGKLTLKLLRFDYDPEELPIFDYQSGLLEIKDDATTAIDNSHSEIVVKWWDPVSNNSRETRVQNLAGIMANQTVTSTSVEYLGCPTALLAARLAQRDLSLQGSGIKRYTIKTDRRGRKIAPGGVFRINVPSRGINNMVVRCGRIEEGPVTEQTILITVVQDVFSLETTTYITPEFGSWTPPDRTAYAVETRQVAEINYRDLVRVLRPADLALVPVDSGGPVTLALQPSPLSVEYVLETKASGEEYAQHGRFVWTPTATLGADIGYYDTTDIPLAEGSGLGLVAVGGVAWVDDELVLITALDLGAMTFAIGRGCVDTVPAPHASGARVWFPETAQGSDGREYTTGEVVNVKLLTRTNASVLALADAPEDTITIAGRQGRPYPPGDVRTNGDRFGDDIPTGSGEVIFTWAERDRITQADHVLRHEESSVGPELGTTYNLRLYDGVTLIRDTTGITGTTWTYDSAMISADVPPLLIGVELESERDGLISTQKYVWTMGHFTIGGFDFDFDNHFS